MTWDPVGTECLGHQPGTDTLMRVSGEIFGTTTNGQTYVCRNISGSTKKSFHAEGRAGDSSGYPGPMRALADGFVAHAIELGIQEVIYDRRRWATDDGEPNWEPFGGSDPHTSHVHWSLTWDAAKNLTETKIRAVLLGEPEDPEVTPDECRTIIREELVRFAKPRGPLDLRIADRVGHLGDGVVRTVANAIRTIKPKQ